MSSLNPEQSQTSPPDPANGGKYASGYWKDLQELEAIPEGEFPPGASEWPKGWTRRDFLRLMGASLALAGASGCTRQPLQQIVPYIRQPEELIPGQPLRFATALTLGGFARGVLVETHEGRPTKIEGNPRHPSSGGASDVFMQAELLGLYDPERSRAVLNNRQMSTWENFSSELGTLAAQWEKNQGMGLRLLTEHETSPTFLDQMQRLLAKYPGAKWFEHSGVVHTPPGFPHADLHLEKAKIVVSFDLDFLGCGPETLRHTREFIAARRNLAAMNRLYVFESTPSLTGAMAEHRFPRSPEQLVKSVEELIAGKGDAALRAIHSDLKRNPGQGLVLAGPSLPGFVHEAILALNSELGNIGRTVEYREQPKTPAGDLAQLVEELRAGEVETLVIVGGNPVYTAPADFEFGALLKTVPRAIHLGRYHDETGVKCHWHLPEAHPLETWSDATATDGTPTIMQPLIEPLFGGRSRHQILLELLRDAPATSYQIVRAYWQKQRGELEFESFWRNSLHEGIAAPSISGVAIGPERPPSGALNPGELHKPQRQQPGGFHLVFRPSAQVYDGRFSNNPWLQEFPEPISKLVWDNAAYFSPAKAAELQLQNGDVVKLKFRGRSVLAPVWLLPGQADDCVTVDLGYGHAGMGSIAKGVGFNAYGLRTSDAPWGGAGLEIESTGQKHLLVTTQHHWNMEGRGQVRVGSIEEYQSTPERIVQHGMEEDPAEGHTLYPKAQGESLLLPAWAMAIDLNTCIGCGACTIACQAENNIPVVGKDQVANNRELHWIRVDRYFHGEPSNPRMYHQPVPCMHCETAPCELVCPVAATVHSGDGLNQMVYNRCIGTRYCSNNCPYKVRRFNFLEYDNNRFEAPQVRRLGRNPNVTVRSRGVMEKCTYCVQRINAAKIQARKENRAIRDGEVIPACAQACPAEAIVFGDQKDAKSRVYALKQSPLNYGLLAELNTRPRTTYLAKINNPNRAIEPS